MTRRGLVLGAGGVLGAAWTTGALAALEQASGRDSRDAGHLVGTSAGSVLAALLGAGVAIDDLRRHQLGEPVEEGPLSAHSFEPGHDTGGALPPPPRPGIGSRQLLARAALAPHRFPPLAVMSSMLPRGRGSLMSVARLVEAVSTPGAWSPHDALWIVAMDYDSGRRVPFGREGAPTAALPDAVRASCAIPGWYEPVSVAGRRYVDGGTCSITSADLLAGRALDEVVVLAPMAAFEYDRPASVAARLERGFRRTVTRRMLREVGKVRATGTEVTVLCPGPEDLATIGVNLMDPTRVRAVLETSLRTSTEGLRRARVDEASWGA